MIDYLSLAVGHALLAIALLRLVMREELDVDPKLQEYADRLKAERDAASASGRQARRRAVRGRQGADGQTVDGQGEAA